MLLEVMTELNTGNRCAGARDVEPLGCRHGGLYLDGLNAW